ncbi:DNA helicase [Citromicrobium bathyomarinum]|uniref:DNA helicase n=1 Tax=Citromicrobium bathyomarinum TaxID=72174 RepID=UPI00315AEC67
MRLSQPIYQLKRRAKLLAREAGIPLHAAQDRIAQGEGYDTWSLLSAKRAEASRPASILPELADGDLALIAARPRQGKTRIGLQLLVDAVRAGRRAVFFTLEFTEAQTLALLAEMGAGDDLPEIVATDHIDAASIGEHLAGAAPGSVAVIDYLQVLDQRRETPVLADQLASLRDFARTSGAILAFISQVDRAYEPAVAQLPGLANLRMPNPVPLDLFAKACFTHAGETQVQAVC